MRRIKLKNGTSISKRDMRELSKSIFGTGFVYTENQLNNKLIEFSTINYKHFIQRYIGQFLTFDGFSVFSTDYKNEIKVYHEDELVFTYGDVLIDVKGFRLQFYHDIIEFFFLEGISDDTWVKYIKANYRLWDTKLSRFTRSCLYS